MWKIWEKNGMDWVLLLHLPRLMESDTGFQPWRDYMGLSEAIREILARKAEASLPESAGVRDSGSVHNDVLCSSTDPGVLSASVRPLGSSAPKQPADPPSDAQGAALQDASTERKTTPAPRRQPRNSDRRQWTRSGTPEPMSCSFCKQNGESVLVYRSHRLKNQAGEVLCPYLRQYVCPLCGATGAKAHTKRFCPLVDSTYSSVYTQSRRWATRRKTRRTIKRLFKDVFGLCVLLHVCCVRFCFLTCATLFGCAEIILKPSMFHICPRTDTKPDMYSMVMESF